MRQKQKTYYATPKGKATRRRYQRTPAARKKQAQRRLKQKYGLTVEAYDELFARQEGRCAICRRDVKLVVDHCHTTGEVRGLLCTKCNWFIGWLETHRHLIRSAVRYLRSE